MGRWLIGLLVLNLALLAIGAGMAAPPVRSGALRVGLVFDVGGIGDKSFNDSAYRGILRAREELDIAAETLEPASGADREAYLEKFAKEGFDLVIGVGFIFTDDITRLARRYPNVRFACVDYAIESGPNGELLAADRKAMPANLVALTFREEEGSMLVGALAGRRALRGSKIVGFVGGMKIPLIEKFEAGFVAGVRAACSDCRVMSAYAGSEPKAFADPTMGRELAMAQFGAGAEVIFHASGKTGEGVFRAARESGKLAIGVDRDQSEEAPGFVLTSMVKAVDRAVLETIRDVRDGHFQSGVRAFGLANRGVGWVNNETNRALSSAEDRAVVEALSVAIVEGGRRAPTKMAEVGGAQ